MRSVETPLQPEADVEEAGMQLSRERFEMLDELVVRSPYGRLIGAELVAASEGDVRVRLPFRRELTTVADVVHGGAISALIDVAATASFWASHRVPAGARGTTIGFSVSFLSAGRAKDLFASAKVRRRGREISTGEVLVQDSDGKDVALALVTYKLSAAG